MYNKNINKSDPKYIEDIAGLILDEYPSSDNRSDISYWNRYYSNFDDRFDYLTHIGQFSLPMIERKIPLQKRYIDFLVSKKSRRPFKYNVYLDSEEVRKSKFEKEIKDFVAYAITRAKGLVYDMNMKVRQIEKKIGEMTSAIQQQEEQAKAQGVSVPPEAYEQIENYISQLNFIKEQLAEELKLGKEVIDDYAIEKSLTPTAILEKVMTKYLIYLEKVVKFNVISTSTFKSKLITGKSALMVAKFGEEETVIREIKHSAITYPKDGTTKKLNKKDWVYYSEKMSVAQINEYFGDELKKKYNDGIIEELEKYNGYRAQDNRPIYALPNGGAIFGNGSLADSAVDSSKTVNVIWMWFRGSIPIYRKCNKDKHGVEHKHILVNKIPIEKSEYNYKNGYYINKKNKNEKHKKESVSVYDKSKGDKIEKRLKYKLFHTIQIDGQYFVNTSEWKNLVRDKDFYNRFNLPIFGEAFDDETSQPYSLIAATNDIQDLIDIVHISREYMIAVAGTKSNIIDVSQKPDYMSEDEWEMNFKLGRYYIQTVDSNGIPKRTNFNQFQSFDNSLSQGVQYYDNVLNSLENLMGQIIGVSYQSLGETVSSDQVKSNQMAIQQTSLVTEMLFYDHSLFEVEALEEYLNLKINDLDKKDFIFSDIQHNGTKEYILKTDKIGDENIKVNLYNSGEDYQKVQDLRQIALQMHNELKMKFSDVIKIFGSDTVKEMEAKVKYFEEQQLKLAGEQANAAQANALEHEKAVAKIKAEMDIFINQHQNKMMEAELQLKNAEYGLNVRKQEFEEKAKMINLKLLSDSNKVDLVKVKEDTAVEKSMLKLDDKHQTVDEQIRLLEIKINAANAKDANKIKTIQANKPMKSQKTINDN